METRPCTIFTGEEFDVPRHIVRLDHRATHGWQLRLGKSKLFSDHSNDGSGATAALGLATDELARRIARMPAPTGLRTQRRADKAHGMPLGVSGPSKRQRDGSGPIQYYLQVTYPVPGGKSVNRSVYIATENTLTKVKYQAALEKAIALRDSGVRKFKLASTKMQRAAAAEAGL